MADFSPHNKLFENISRINTVNKFIFWVILGLSIIPIIFKEYIEELRLVDTINILNIVGIGLFFILEIITEYILLPQADNKRRDDFIDNSFGSNFSVSNSKGYYDNDEIKAGIYKAGVNLFENCFFTYALVQTTFYQKIIIPAIGFIIITVFAYYGLKEVPLALSILQTIFSANVLGLLIKHIILLNRLSALQNSWIALFQSSNIQTSPQNYQSHILRYWIQYETLLSKINSDIPKKTFEKLNPSLTKDWGNLKQKLNIR